MRHLALALSLALSVGCGRGGLWDGDSNGAFGGASGVGGAQTSGVTSGPNTSVGVGSAAGGSSGSVTASGTGQSTGSGPMTCAPFNDACTQCASSNCPEIWCGCVNNPDCVALFQCFGSCMMDPTCEQGCLSMHSEGISAVVLVSGCAGTTCSGFCNWGNPGFNDCQECIYTDCASEMNACLAMPDCSLLYQCLSGCAPLDLSCQQQCYLDYPGGVELLETALQCISSQCQNECQ
jgi:hypothetical protein